MQKIFLGLLSLLLIGIFLFIQNNKEDTSKVIPIPSEVKKVNTYQKEKDIQINTPFKSNINLTHKETKVFTSEDIKKIESSTSIELQKELFIDIQERLTTEIQNIPSCLENARNRNEAQICSQKLQNIHKEFALLLGIETSDTDNDYTIDNTWNETIKENMIKELDASIEPMQELFSCLQVSETEEDQEACFEIEE